MPGDRLMIRGQDRMEFGYIVTAREQSSGERWVLHRSGQGSLEAICGELDAAEGDWRVLCISTPETIYRDLQGTRMVEWVDDVLIPEPRMLGKIGRLDLLDPVHDPSIPRGQSHA